MPPKNRIESIRLQIVGGLKPDEIQDEIVLRCCVVPKAYKGVVGGREIQDELGIFEKSALSMRP